MKQLIFLYVFLTITVAACIIISNTDDARKTYNPILTGEFVDSVSVDSLNSIQDTLKIK